MDKKEVGTSVAKSIISIVPYAGQAINELLFEYRGRVKQSRLNNFTEMLVEYLGESVGAIITDRLNNEEFGDVFEGAIRGVVNTRSKEKVKLFRNIVVRQIEDPVGIDYVDVYLELVNNLNEKEIEILNAHYNLDTSFYEEEVNKRKVVNRRKELTAQIESKHSSPLTPRDYLIEDLHKVEAEYRNLNPKIAKLEEYRVAKIYNISDDRFLYHKQNLLSKGLLIDSGVGSLGHEPYKYMSITEFGKQFIEFVETPIL